MTEQSVVRALHLIYQIAEAGEKGYATAAVNMPNPALKVLFKIYAQQRLTYKNEILHHLSEMGGVMQQSTSILGIIHRGRLAIFAGMATDQKSQETMILKEAALGERVAVQTYQRVLAKDLPEQTRELLERQYEEVRKVSERVKLLRADEQYRSAVWVSTSEQDADQAVQSLIGAGFRTDEIERMDLNDQVLYQGKGATQLETILSGAFGGALWGGLTGILAGIGVIQTTNPVGTWTAVGIWLLVALAFALGGAMISSILALFIGFHISGEDNFQYPGIHANAQVLVHPRMGEVNHNSSPS
jgi:uncharacterized protein (TIGR02284 family)